MFSFILLVCYCICILWKAHILDLAHELFSVVLLRGVFPKYIMEHPKAMSGFRLFVRTIRPKDSLWEKMAAASLQSGSGVGRPRFYVSHGMESFVLFNDQDSPDSRKSHSWLIIRYILCKITWDSSLSISLGNTIQEKKIPSSFTVKVLMKNMREHAQKNLKILIVACF